MHCFTQSLLFDRDYLILYDNEIFCRRLNSGIVCSSSIVSSCIVIAVRLIFMFRGGLHIL